ncbi:MULTISPECIES: alpha/beta hydrolase [Pantoea]|uniref:alpha/beta hydrolase n=1 Tax=Pantoea TaxID=53335 RepID=UPI000CF48837|nr:MULTISPECIES: alpha/beta hydrolase [Pantoea]MCH9299914.1 alpha/beta hydrolase fold domain-containing protein [Pantoea allii]PQK87846.1 hypothetical protein CG433_22020 [Pantoea ananatis]
MEPSLDTLSKYRPCEINNGSLFFSGDESDLYSLEYQSLIFTKCNYIAYYSCQYFSLKQFESLDTLISFKTPENDVEAFCKFESYIESLSIEISCGSFNVLIHPESPEEEAVIFSLNNEYNLSKQAVPNDPANCFIKINFSLAVKEDEKELVNLNGDEITRYDEILCISHLGVLLRHESLFGDKIIWASANGAVITAEIGCAVLCAAIDAVSQQIFLSVEREGLQCISVYCIKDLRNTENFGKLYGTATPFFYLGKIIIYGTGSIDGIGLYTPDGIRFQTIRNGLSDYCYINSSAENLKVLSLLPENEPTVHFLFFHGGPESCEWDNPRMPGVINEMSKHNAAFHILNYAGSTRFGSVYRNSVNGDVMNRIVTPVIAWLNEKICTDRIILFGASFGGTIALELLCRRYEINSMLTGILLVNPLLDLRDHIERVKDLAGDVAFFDSKFGKNDMTYVDKNRYLENVNSTDIPVSLQIGRRDEVIDFRVAYDFAKLMKKNTDNHLHIDDGGHAPLSHFASRQQSLLNFLIQRKIWLCKTALID